MAADAEVRLHGIVDHAVLADEIGRAPHPDAERPIDVVRLRGNLVLVTQQFKGQVVLLAEARMAVGVLGLTPATCSPTD